MTTAFKEVKRKALNLLRAKERAALAHDLIISLEEKSDTGVGDAWDSEISRRVDEINSGFALGRPAIQVLAEKRAKYS